jgi:hypothetical protein
MSHDGASALDDAIGIPGAIARLPVTPQPSLDRRQRSVPPRSGEG